MADKRVTMKDISNLLGVATNTVSKALTGKDRISDEMRALIIKTADDLGYKPNKTARALIRKEISIGIILAKEPSEYLSYFRKGIEEKLFELSDYKVNGIYKFYANKNATHEVITALTEMAQENIDGLIFSPAFGYAAYYNIIEDIVVKKSLPTIFLNQTLGSIQGITCIKGNSNATGHLAAEFLSICMPEGGSVAIITPNREHEFHNEIIKGFFEEIADRPNIIVKTIQESQDNYDITYGVTRKIMIENPDIRAIYIASYNSPPVCRCLADLGLDKNVVVLGQDVYPGMVEYMNSGQLKATIFLNPKLAGTTAVNILYDYLTEKKKCSDNILIMPQLVLKSNLNCYIDMQDNS